jgi:hypothetical protein
VLGIAEPVPRSVIYEANVMVIEGPVIHIKNRTQTRTFCQKKPARLYPNEKNAFYPLQMVVVVLVCHFDLFLMTHECKTLQSPRQCLWGQIFCPILVASEERD